ncbi:MAG: hypothetical protein AAFZ67_08460 [Planctomycetota bacterium]
MAGDTTERRRNQPSVELREGALKRLLEQRPDCRGKTRAEQCAAIRNAYVKRFRGQTFSDRWFYGAMAGGPKNRKNTSMVRGIAKVLGCDLMELTTEIAGSSASVGVHAPVGLDTPDTTTAACFGVFGAAAGEFAEVCAEYPQLQQHLSGRVFECTAGALPSLVGNLLEDDSVASSRLIAVTGPRYALVSPDTLNTFTRFVRLGGEGDFLVDTATLWRHSPGMTAFKEQQFPPLIHGALSSGQLIDTPFGTMERSDLWYGASSRFVLSRDGVTTNMALLSELDYWFNEPGFRYLCSQHRCITFGQADTSRLVIIDKPKRSFNLSHPWFWTLLFTFRAMQIDLYFVYEREFADFRNSESLAGVDQMAVSGSESLLTYNGEKLVSHNRDLASDIGDAQRGLVAQSGVLQFQQFFAQHEGAIARTRAELETRATQALLLFEEFNKLSDSEQSEQIHRYLSRWMNVASR